MCTCVGGLVHPRGRIGAISYILVSSNMFLDVVLNEVLRDIPSTIASRNKNKKNKLGSVEAS